MVALDIVHRSNARLRELGPGLVALFGIVPLAQLPWTSTNQLQLVAQVVLGNLLSKHSYRTQSLLVCTS